MLVRLNTLNSLKILLILNLPSPSHCKFFFKLSRYITYTLLETKMLVINTIILTNERIRTFLFSVNCLTSEY